jgi:hypothetical protein
MKLREFESGLGTTSDVIAASSSKKEAHDAVRLRHRAFRSADCAHYCAGAVR